MIDRYFILAGAGVDQYAASNIDVNQRNRIISFPEANSNVVSHARDDNFRGRSLALLVDGRPIQSGDDEAPRLRSRSNRDLVSFGVAPNQEVAADHVDQYVAGQKLPLLERLEAAQTDRIDSSET